MPGLFPTTDITASESGFELGLGLRSWRCVSIFLMLSITTTIYGAQQQASTGVRAIGMGEAFIGIVDDENSVRRNPAGLARLDRYAFGFEQTPSKLFDVLDTSYLSAVLPASEKIALGIDWLQVGIDDEELDANRNSFNFSYSYSPFSRLSLGVNLKYLTWSISLDGQSKGNATGWGTDVGVLFQPNRRLTIGFLAQDFVGFGSGKGLYRDTWMRHDTGVSEKISPTAYKVGVAYRPVSNWLIATDVTDRLHVGAEFLPNRNFALRGGVQKDLGTSEPPTYSLGGTLRYKWMNFNLAYLIPPTLPPTVYVGLSLNFDFRKLPVLIEQVRMRALYPVHYHYYAGPNRDAKILPVDGPVTPPVFTDADVDRYYPLEDQDSIGRIWLKNASNKPITVQIELFIDQFVREGGTEVASDIVLQPLERISVPMQQLVLSREALELSHAQRVETRIRVTESGGTAYRTATTTLKIHSNDTTLLNDVAKLGSFISSKDPAIHAFKDGVLAEFQVGIDATGSAHGNMPHNLYKAMLLFNALHGISYGTDPNIPGDSGTNDEIKHPHDMLTRLSEQIGGNNEMHAFGDCDDSTALYCSLLESAGIQTALIRLPNHVMMAFDLGGVSLDWAQEADLSDVYYQAINGYVWIPVETTLIKNGFASAWKAASEALQTVTSPNVPEVVPVGEAWEKYGESSLWGEPSQFSIPKEKIQSQIEADLVDSWLQEFLNALP